MGNDKGGGGYNLAMPGCNIVEAPLLRLFRLCVSVSVFLPFGHQCMLRAMMFGITPAARVAHCWLLPLVHLPLDLSSDTLSTRTGSGMVDHTEATLCWLEAVRGTSPQSPASAAH